MLKNSNCSEIKHVGVDLDGEEDSVNAVYLTRKS
jgi:hypothetical protein